MQNGCQQNDRCSGNAWNNTGQRTRQHQKQCQAESDNLFCRHSYTLMAMQPKARHPLINGATGTALQYALINTTFSWVFCAVPFPNRNGSVRSLEPEGFAPQSPG